MAKEKAEWINPGLVGRVRYLKGEEKLRHATLMAVQGPKAEDVVASVFGE